MALTSFTQDFVLKSGLSVEGTISVTSSTGQTGTVQVAGGAAIAQNIIVGSTATIWGDTQLNSTLEVVGQSTLWQLTATVTTVTQLTVMNNEVVYGSLNVTGTTYLHNALTVDGNSQFNGALNTFSGAVFVTGTNSFTVGQGPTDLGGTLNVWGITNLTTNTTADQNGHGALVVGGGVYIGDNLVVNSTSSNTGTSAQNAVYVAGGVWVNHNLTVKGPAVFSDTVTFNGTATYVFSTNTYYTDNIIELHVPPTGTYGQWPGGDGKDIGLRFHHFANNTDTNSALVLAYDTKYLEWYGAGAESNTGVFNDATYGTFRTGNIELKGTADVSGSTQSGSLQVVGGIGVGGGIYADGEIRAGDLKANNLTANNYGFVYADTTGKLVNTSTVTYDTVAQIINGRIQYANTVTSVAGGARGSLLFQTATNSTYSLPIGNTNDVLIVQNGVPYWKTGYKPDFAGTSTNVDAGLKNQIPYQTAPGLTGFSNNLQFNGTTFTTTNIVVTGGVNAASTYSGSLQVQGGVGIGQDVYVGGNINVHGNINIDGSIFLKGAGLDTITSTTGTFVDVVVTGTDYAVTVTNGVYVGTTVTTDMMVIRSTVASTGTTSSNALYVVGGLGVNGTAYFGDTIRVGNNIVTTNQVSGISGVFFGDQYGFNALYGGTSNYAPLPYTVLQLTAGINDYAQSNFQNTNNGPKASTDWVLTSADGANFANFIDMGITSGTWDGTQDGSIGSAVGANDGYLYVQGTTSTVGQGNLSIGVSSTGSVIRFFAGGVGSRSVVATINAPNTQSTSTSTGAFVLKGGAGIGQDLYVGGTINVNQLKINGTVNSTSTNSGALVVAGGIGVGGTIYAGDIYSNGALVGGGVISNFTATTATVTSNLTVEGKIITTLVTSTTYLDLSSNVGYNVDINAGGHTTQFLSSGNIRPAGALTGSSYDSNQVNVANIGPLLLKGIAYGAQIITSDDGATDKYSWNFNTDGTLTAPGNVQAPTATITSGSNAISTNSGALQVAGGVGIGLDLVVGNAVHIGSTASNVVVPAVYSGNSLYASYTSNVISTNSAVNLDTFLTANYRTAKYLVQITDSSKIHVEEILLFHDGSNVYMSIYAISTNQGELGDFDASIVGGNTMTLTFTPNYVPTAMNIKVARTTLTA